MGGHVCVCPLFLYNNKVEMEVIMANYHKLSNELQQQILEDKKQHKENPYACKDVDIIRRYFLPPFKIRKIGFFFYFTNNIAL